jgi:hypothetical protein
MQFLKAAANDLFPEGGLRIVGAARAYYDLYAADQTNLGGWSNSHYAFASISPAGTYNNTVNNTANLFNTSNTLTSLAGSFEFYRFRKLRIHYCPVVGANTNGITNLGGNQMCLGYFQDAAENAIQTTPSRYFNSSTIAFPYWEPASLDCVAERVSSPGDKLFKVGAIGDAISASYVSDYVQGHICASSSVFGSDGTDVPVGSVIADFVLDLYGFREYWAGYSADGARESKEVKLPKPRIVTDDDYEVVVDKSLAVGLSSVKNVSISSAPASQVAGDQGFLAAYDKRLRAGAQVTEPSGPPRGK